MGPQAALAAAGGAVYALAGVEAVRRGWPWPGVALALLLTGCGAAVVSRAATADAVAAAYRAPGAAKLVLDVGSLPVSRAEWTAAVAVARRQRSLWRSSARYPGSRAFAIAQTMLPEVRRTHTATAGLARLLGTAALLRAARGLPGLPDAAAWAERPASLRHRALPAGEAALARRMGQAFWSVYLPERLRRRSALRALRQHYGRGRALGSAVAAAVGAVSVRILDPSPPAGVSVGGARAYAAALWRARGMPGVNAAAHGRRAQQALPPF